MTKTLLNIEKKDDGVFINITNLGIASRRNQSGTWTIFCPALKVLGFSTKSKNDAFADFEANLNAFFDVHVTDNTLERALLKFNWKKGGLNNLFGGLNKNKPKFAINNEPSLDPQDFNLAIAA